MKRALILLSIFLSACSTTTLVESFDRASLDDKDDLELADLHFRYTSDYWSATYHASPSAIKQLQDELAERGLERWELESAAKNRVVIGMSVLGVYAAWGEPTRINTTATANGSRHQYVFGKYQSQYAYIEDGKVVAIQS